MPVIICISTVGFARLSMASDTVDTGPRLELTGISSNRARLILYQQLTSVPSGIYSKQSLSTPAWSPEAAVWPKADATPFSVGLLDRPGLFLRARPGVAPSSLGMGPLHTIALRHDGTLFAWGIDDSGELGDGKWMGSPVPVQVLGLTNIIAVAVPMNGYFNLALDSAGCVWSWGAGAYGQLGRGDGLYRDSNVPVPVAGLSNIVAIAAGFAFGTALKSDGTVWTWGWNDFGQLGAPGSAMRDCPAPVAGLSNVIVIAAGSDHALALDDSGQVWAWGYNGDGELGIGTTRNQFAPVRIPRLAGAVSLAGGFSHSLALLADGTVAGWGDNSFGQVGVGQSTKWGLVLSPSTVPGLNRIISIAAGGNHSLGLATGGSVQFWGNNWDYEAGDGTRDGYENPAALASFTNVVAIAGSEYGTAAMLSDGTVIQCGQYGYSSAFDWRSQPTPFAYRFTDASDSDADGLPDWFENQTGSDPADADSDGDGIADREELLLGTNPRDAADATHVRLGDWTFDSQDLAGDSGRQTLALTNIHVVPSWGYHAVHIGTNAPAILSYRQIETNVPMVLSLSAQAVTQHVFSANVLVRQGSVRFWFNPDWSGAHAGGVGPGTNAILFCLGRHPGDSPTPSTRFWGLEFDAPGDRLIFSSVTCTGHQVYLDVPVDVSSNLWRQITLTYSPLGSELYIDGQLAGWGQGVDAVALATFPQDLALNIGSDSEGAFQAFGRFDNLETFNYPLQAGEIASSFAAMQSNPTVVWPGTFTQSSSIHLKLEGVPAAILTVMVDDTNFDSAIGQKLTADVDIDVPVEFAPGDGVHTANLGVYDGHGFVWDTRKIVVDTTPPVILPEERSFDTSVGLLQLNAYSTEDLAGISFDLTNTQSTNLDQAGFIIGSDIGAGIGESSTNLIRCHDILLAPGLNTITLRCTDLAGNVSTNIYSCNYDPSASTSPPILSIDWPQDGAVLSGTRFRITGRVDDPSASVVAMFSNANSTDTIPAVVERTGHFWIDDIPVYGPFATISVVATRASGFTTTNTITVRNGPVRVTVNPPEEHALNSDSMTVTGSMNCPGYDLTINGVKAAIDLNPDGTIFWRAANVPVPDGSVGVFDIRTSPALDTNFPPALAAGPRAGQALSAPDIRSPAVARESFNKSDFIRVSRYYENLKINIHQHAFVSCDDQYNDWALTRSRQWRDGAGGEGSAEFFSRTIRYWGDPLTIGPCQSEFTWAPERWPTLSPPLLLNDSCPYDDYFQTYGQVPVIPRERFDYGDEFSRPLDHCGASQVYHRVARTSLELVVGGRSDPARPKKVILKASASEFSGFTFPLASTTAFEGDIHVFPGQILIAGARCIDSGDGTNGLVSLTVPAGVTNLDITPVVRTAGFPNYAFDVQLVDMQIATDLNRDGVITFDGADATSKRKPFRFWINDDSDDDYYTDVASDENDVPGSPKPNYADTHVNGRRDLVDFFPVALRLGDALKLCPPSEGYEFRLSQPDDAINFVYTDLKRTEAFDYLKRFRNEGYGIDFTMDPTMALSTQVTRTGVPLLPRFLNQITKDPDKGVLLIEARAPTRKPLMLEIWRNGRKLAYTSLDLSIDGVESMFRRLNLRDGADAPAGLAGNLDRRDHTADLPTNLSEPSNFPDKDLNNHWLVFVVGSNVNGDSMRGWKSEVFKRLYWSRCKARFLGVSWFGDPYRDIELVYDYHAAVRNAFATASSLAAVVNGLQGTRTIAGHSLGCGVIASAITDHSMNVRSACFFDAALAAECFDGDAAEDLFNMGHPDWMSASNPSMPAYPRRYWASDFYKLYLDTTDPRQLLTWENRFSAANAVIYNFYSSTEDVLAPLPGRPTPAIIKSLFESGFKGAYAWVVQEKTKGNKVTLPPSLAHVGSDYGGWGFNLKDPLIESDPLYWHFNNLSLMRQVKPPQELIDPGDIILKRHPLFEPGWGVQGETDTRHLDINPGHFTGPQWIRGLYDPDSGDFLLSDPTKRDQLLAEAIPALSTPTGARLIDRFGNRNFNMPTRFADRTLWPREVSSGGIPKWWHSDMRNMNYNAVRKLYDELALIAEQ